MKKLGAGNEDEYQKMQSNYFPAKPIRKYKSYFLKKRRFTNSLKKKIFLTKTRDEWVNILTSSNVPAAPVYDYLEVVDDPHLKYRNLFFEIEKGEQKLKQIAHPLKFSLSDREKDLPPPELGEHSEEILLGLGYSGKQIDEFRQANVI